MPAAPFVFKDAYVAVNSVDLSDWVSSVTVTLAYDEIETTAMGATSHEYVKGLQSSTIDITFNNDFSGSASYATVYAEIGEGDSTVSVRPTSAAIGSTNPSFNMTKAMISSMPVLTGAVGDLAQFSVQAKGLIAVATS